MASSKREKELARQRAERQAARRAAAAQRSKQRTAVIASVAAVVLVVLAAVAVGVAVSGGDDVDELATPEASPTAVASAEPSVEPSPETEPSVEPEPSAAVDATGVSCEYPAGGQASKPAATPPSDDVENELVLDVQVATNRGDIVFEMDTSQAPCTASSLRTLASVGFFDDTPCHRLTTQGISVLQCGDPTGTGRGGPGYTFANENLDDERIANSIYPRGTVAMANGGPDTNGSQFFLVYDDSPLPPAYTPFGRITAGLDVLDGIAAAGSDNSSGAGDGAPNQPVQIERLRVTARES